MRNRYLIVVKYHPNIAKYHPNIVKYHVNIVKYHPLFNSRSTS